MKTNLSMSIADIRKLPGLLLGDSASRDTKGGKGKRGDRAPILTRTQMIEHESKLMPTGGPAKINFRRTDPRHPVWAPLLERGWRAVPVHRTVDGRPLRGLPPLAFEHRKHGPASPAEAFHIEGMRPPVFLSAPVWAQRIQPEHAAQTREAA